MYEPDYINALAEHHDVLKDYEHKMVEFNIASGKEKNVNKKIELLLKSIYYCELLYEFCDNNGLTKYAKIWRECNATYGVSFDYLDRLKETLNEIQTNYEIYKQQEITNTYIEQNSIKIKEQILDIIKNNSGILQTTLYKNFDINIKSFISEVLYYFAKENKITREKKGNTYALFYNE